MVGQVEAGPRAGVGEGLQVVGDAVIDVGRGQILGKENTFKRLDIKVRLERAGTHPLPELVDKVEVERQVGDVAGVLGEVSAVVLCQVVQIQVGFGHHDPVEKKSMIRSRFFCISVIENYILALLVLLGATRNDK